MNGAADEKVYVEQAGRLITYLESLREGGNPATRVNGGSVST
jgi:hypothetical protein